MYINTKILTLIPTLLFAIASNAQSLTPEKNVSSINVYTSCLEEICGPSEELITPAALIENILHKKIDEINNDVTNWSKTSEGKQFQRMRDGMTKLFNGDWHHSHRLTDTASAMLPITKASINIKLATIHNQNYFKKKLYKNLGAAGAVTYQVDPVERAFFTFKIRDPKKLAASFTEVPEEDRPYAVKEFKKFIALQEVSRMFAQLLLPITVYVKSYYPDLTLTEAIKQEALNGLTIEGNLSKNNPNIYWLMRDMQGENLFQKALNNPSSLGEEELGSFFYTVEHIMLKKRASSYQSRLVIDPAKIVNKEILAEMIERRKNVKESDVEIILNRCENHHLRFHLSSPTQEELQNFQGETGIVVQAAKSIKELFLDRLYSPEAALKIAGTLEGLHFTYPKVSGEYYKEELDELLIWMEIIIGDSKLLEDPTADYILYKLQDFDPESNAALNLCKNTNFNPLADSLNLYSSGIVNLSWYSLKYPPKGKTILLHEMGHQVDMKMRGLDNIDQVSLDKHNKLRSCLSKLHPKSDLVDSHYVNEDFADLVSSYANRDISETQPAYCAFLSWSYGDYNDPYEIVRHQTKSGKKLADSHSNTLLRILLQENAYRGSLPNFCPVLEKTPESVCPEIMSQLL